MNETEQFPVSPVEKYKTFCSFCQKRSSGETPRSSLTACVACNRGCFGPRNIDIGDNFRRLKKTFMNEKTESRYDASASENPTLCCKTESVDSELRQFFLYKKPSLVFQRNNFQTSFNENVLSSLLRNFYSLYLLFIQLPSFFQIFYVVLTFILLTQSVTTDAYVLTQEGRTHTYLHKRLSGRERRDVQREILSILGLDHKPKINTQQSFEKSSAPLYMLGLYSSASSFSRREFTDISQSASGAANSQQRLRSRSANRYHRMSRFTGPFAVDPIVDVLPSGIETELNRYIEDSGILTNEVGVFDFSQEQHAEGQQRFNNGLTNNEEEKQLLDQSDLVISFINTRQRHSPNEDALPSVNLRPMLRRYRSFFFDINRASVEDNLTAAKFRLYKEICEESVENQTLRVNVYQTVSLPDESAGVYLLGSRLVGSNQEGWLVYDVTSALRDWLNRPASNLGVKVTVETLKRKYLKPTKTGIIGRKGPAAKQAFMVAFFSQNQDVRLHENFRRRVRRSPDSSLVADDGEEEDDGLLEDDENENDTDATADEEAILDGEDFDEDSKSDEDSGTTIASTVSSEDTNEEDTRSRRRARAKGQKSRKKNRKRKRPKNSSKRKPTSEHCHKKPLYVNFRDLGWDTWIIAPPGYPAYQCIGECSFPLNAQMNATNHAIVQSLVHLSLPHMKIPQPCCSPTTLEPISVLYYNDKTNVVYKKYQNMIVSSCGCH